jgi:hypothetical protein
MIMGHLLARFAVPVDMKDIEFDSCRYAGRMGH